MTGNFKSRDFSPKFSKTYANLLYTIHGYLMNILDNLRSSSTYDEEKFGQTKISTQIRNLHRSSNTMGRKWTDS